MWETIYVDTTIHSLHFKTALGFGTQVAAAWAGKSARRRAVPSRLEAARGSASRTEEADDASTRAALLLLKTESTVTRMADSNAARRRAVRSQLDQAHLTVSCMVEADAASRRAVPRQLQAAAFLTAWRTAEASAAGRMNASS